ncbi:MAG: hypothetical protein J6U49_03720 [Alistipes sp.]|nr:hypothetical protein [Alistipes sp.]
MKTSWEKSIYVIFVPIYILSLYCAIKFPEQGVWPFVMLNIGALTGVPNIIKMLKRDNAEGDEKSAPAEGRRYWKYLLAYISAALLISLVIDMFLDKNDDIGYIGVLVMFASIFVVFIITDLFLVVLPKHKKSNEKNDDQSDSEYSNN